MDTNTVTYKKVNSSRYAVSKGSQTIGYVNLTLRGTVGVRVWQEAEYEVRADATNVRLTVRDMQAIANACSEITL
jgi:hypothetical protein